MLPWKAICTWRATTSIPLEVSRYEWLQHLDHRGRPRSKVRAGRWSFVTTNLDPAHYQQLLALMLSPGPW